MKTYRVKRYIFVFNKNSDALIRSYEITRLNLNEIRRLFRQKPRDPMYYCYPITEKEAPYFQKKYGNRFYFKKYVYFLDCASIERKTKPVGRILSLEFTKIKGNRPIRLLSVYKTKSDKHVRSYELPHFNLREVRRAFGQKTGDKVYYVYPITEKEAPYFRKKYGKRFYFKSREYFLETKVPNRLRIRNMNHHFCKTSAETK